MFAKKDEETYQPLAERIDDSEEDDDSSPSHQVARKGTTRPPYPSSLKWIAAVAALVTTSIVSMHFGAYMASRPQKLDPECAAHTTQWSPVLRDVDIEYEWKEFNGSFMHENVYRKEGSPEVDAAWEALGVDYRAGVISMEDGLASGLDHSFVQMNPKYGSGFFVNVEGMHHLHCLNLVRKSLYYNIEYYRKQGSHAFMNEEHILRLHISHCLDAVRQVLMCNIDTGVLGQVWAGAEDPAAFPDFNTRHRCKNYDAVRQWAEKLQAPDADSVPADYLKPPGQEDVIPVIP